MPINWNMVILLVFITFNITQVCTMIKQVWGAKHIIKSMPKSLLQQMVDASIEDSKYGNK